MNKFYDKTVLITGAGGFLGQHLLRALLTHSPRQIIGLTRSARPKNIPDEVKWLQLDLLDAPKSGVLEEYQPNLIFHLAAEIDPSWSYPLPHYFQRCFYPGLGLLDAIKGGGQKPEHVIFVGSNAEYGSALCPQNPEKMELPTSPYGVAKLAQTKMAQAWGITHEIPVSVVRPFMIYGEGMSEKTFLASARLAAKAGRKLAVTSGRQTRDFVSVGQVLHDLLAVALDLNYTGRVVNSCTGHGIVLTEILDFLVRNYPNFHPEMDAIPERLQDLKDSWGIPLFPQTREEAWNSLAKFLLN